MLPPLSYLKCFYAAICLTMYWGGLEYLRGASSSESPAQEERFPTAFVRTRTLRPPEPERRVLVMLVHRRFLVHSVA
eukprot:8028733-Pyramimonas_sp.AAC.1